MMNTNEFTQRTTQAIQAAQRLAAAHQNQQIEQAHLLLALLQQENGLIPQLLKKMGVSVESLTAAAQAAVEKLPAVTGSGRDADQFYISRGMDQLLAKAQEHAQSMRDDYVSVEHLFLAMLDTADQTVKPLLDDYRITKEAALQTLQAVRGAARVTTDNPEDTYEALAKYGTDLTAAFSVGGIVGAVELALGSIIKITENKEVKKNDGHNGNSGTGSEADIHADNDFPAPETESSDLGKGRGE